jgi:hypothetical protein
MLAERPFNPALNLAAFAVRCPNPAPRPVSAFYLRDGKYDGMTRQDVATTFATFRSRTITDLMALFFHGGLVDKASGQQWMGMTCRSSAWTASSPIRLSFRQLTIRVSVRQEAIFHLLRLRRSLQGFFRLRMCQRLSGFAVRQKSMVISPAIRGRSRVLASVSARGSRARFSVLAGEGQARIASSQ